MFITHPPYEFRMPPTLAVPGARHWRVMELHIHLPWFLLSVRNQYSPDDTTFVQTFLFAWETDFAEFLSHFDARKVVSLACMAPGWKSATGNWSSHEVREVWSVQTEDGSTYLDLKGGDGASLDVGLPIEPGAPVAVRTRLLKVPPTRRSRAGTKPRPKGVQREGRP